MNSLMKAGLIVGLVCAPVLAAPNFSEDWEAGSAGWTMWPGANDSFIRDSAHNHTLGGAWSAKTPESDPATWAAYYDFGGTSGFVRAEAYVYEDFSNDGTNPAQPISNMLALTGDQSPPGFSVDYLQLGVVPFYPSGSTGYGYRTKYNDDNALGFGNANVGRKAGWTKLAIEADALANGGQVRFYIDDGLVGTSQRSGDLRYVRIGNTNKSYENFWYDDILVTPEPASLLLLIAGGWMVRRRSGR